LFSYFAFDFLFILRYGFSISILFAVISSFH